MKPSIEILREFVRPYFDGDCCPIIRWGEMDEEELRRRHIKKWGGWANRRENLVILNPQASVHLDEISVGGGWNYLVENLNLIEGEQFFLTLIHEIGHFKELWEPSEEWLSIREELEKEHPDNRELQAYSAQDYLGRKEGESDDDYYSRVDLLASWICGDDVIGHVEVENWAVEEFRRRGEVLKLLQRGRIDNSEGREKPSE